MKVKVKYQELVRKFKEDEKIEQQEISESIIHLIKELPDHHFSDLNIDDINDEEISDVGDNDIDIKSLDLKI